MHACQKSNSPSPKQQHLTLAILFEWWGKKKGNMVCLIFRQHTLGVHYVGVVDVVRIVCPECLPPGFVISSNQKNKFNGHGDGDGPLPSFSSTADLHPDCFFARVRQESVW